jgi:hypothetical protein
LAILDPIGILMAIVPISLPLGSGQGRYGLDGAARVVNGYSEIIGEGGKVQTALYCMDGLSRFATGTSGGVRNLLAMTDSELLCVIGRGVFRCNSGGTLTRVGGIATDGLVTSARNRASPANAVFVSDGLVSVYTSGVFTTLDDPDLPPPNSVFQLSGYFIFPQSDGSYFYSDVDAITVDGLDFQSGSSDGRGIVRGYARGQDGLLFGPRSTRVIQDVGGDTGATFGNVTTIPLGLLSPWGVCDVDQTCAFLSHDGTVRILDGYQGAEISTHEVSRLIAADTAPDRIQLFGWKARGHSFVGVSGTDWTRVYDLKTKAWHDRESWQSTKWRCSSAVQFGTKRIFGHHSSPYLFESDPDLQTEDGDPILWGADLPPVHASPVRLQASALHLDMIVGQGLGTGASQDVDPSVMLRWSDDGGSTWSAERQIPVGRQGQRRTRVVARRLGVIPHTGRTIRVRQSASVIRGIMSAHLDAVKLGA